MGDAHARSAPSPGTHQGGGGQCVGASFDELDHSAILGRVRERIADKRVMALIKAFLKAGILTELGDLQATVTGTPQGGILAAPMQSRTSSSSACSVEP